MSTELVRADSVKVGDYITVWSEQPAEKVVTIRTEGDEYEFTFESRHVHLTFGWVHFERTEG